MTKTGLGSYIPLRGRSGQTVKAWRGKEGYKEAKALEKTVYRATSKNKARKETKKGSLEGRFFSDYKKTVKDISKQTPKKERVILKSTLSKKQHNVGKKLFMKFVPPKFGEFGGGKPARFGRIILPKSAKVKVDRVLTKEVRKIFRGGLITGRPKLATRGWK